MRGEGVAPARGGDQRVVGAALVHGFVQHARVQLVAGGEQSVLAGGEFNQRLNEGFSVSRVPRAAQRAEVIDGSDVIIAQHEVAVNRIAGNGESGFIAYAVRVYGNRVGGSNVQIAPVDGDAVAAVSEHALLRLTDEGDVQTADHVVIEAQHGLQGVVIAQGGGSVHAHGDLVRPSVHGARGEAHKGDGGGERVQIVRQRGGLEGDGQLNARGLHHADRGGGRHAQGGGLHRGNIDASAQEAIAPAVDFGDAGHVLHFSAPMNGVRVGQRVAGQPDGKIGVVCNQRKGGQTINAHV